MRCLRTCADGLYRLLDVLCAVGMLLLFAMICVSVFLRYIANSSIYGLSEVMNYLFVYLTALGAVCAMRHNEHVGVDFFVHAPEKTQLLLRLFRLLVIAVVQGFLLVLSFPWIARVGKYLTPLLRFEQRWAQLAVPLGMGLGILMCALCMAVGYGVRNEGELDKP
ncbi:MAG: TRAP transporter small permease [Candidatus Limiplasma sp.]|nr:TRAP transporter small permease [Candidatus Limiplasma sp.]